MNLADWMIIVFVALLIFGPKSLPKVSVQLGEAMHKFRDLMNRFRGGGPGGPAATA